MTRMDCGDRGSIFQPLFSQSCVIRRTYLISNVALRYSGYGIASKLLGCLAKGLGINFKQTNAAWEWSVLYKVSLLV